MVKCYVTATGELRKNEEMCQIVVKNSSQILAKAYWSNYLVDHYIMGDQGDSGTVF